MPGWGGSDRRSRLPPNWVAIRRRVLRRDAICAICVREPSVEVDHIIRGDDHSPENLQGICAPCHSQKSSREGWRASVAARARLRRARFRPPEQHPGGW